MPTKTPSKKTTPRKRTGSGNPAVKAAAVAPVPTVEAPQPKFGAGWRTGAESTAREVVLPSGAVCLAFIPGSSGILAAGIDLEKLDTLSKIVNDKIVQPATKGAMGKQIRPKSTQNLSSQEAIDLLEIADRITAHIVIEPRVILAPSPRCATCGWEGAVWNQHEPTDGHEANPVPRDPTAIYTDGIDIQDKFQLLAFAMEGVTALEPFRDEPEASVDNLGSE